MVELPACPSRRKNTATEATRARDREHDVLEESEADGPRAPPPTRVAPAFRKAQLSTANPPEERVAANTPKPATTVWADTESHLRAVVYPGHVTDGQHVARVGGDLADEADHEPRPWMIGLGEADDARPSGSRGEDEDRTDRCAGRRDDDHGRLVLEPQKDAAAGSKRHD